MASLNRAVQKLIRERKVEPGNFIPDPDYQRVIDGKCDDDEPVITNFELMHNGYEVVQRKDIKVPFGLLEGEQLFYCPYNRSHQVLESKWTLHLQKCRHNYLKAVSTDKPVVKMDMCPYEPNVHHLSEFYMLRHVYVCPSREAYDQKMDAFKRLNTIKGDSIEAENLKSTRLYIINQMDEQLKALYMNPNATKDVPQSSGSEAVQMEDKGEVEFKIEDWEENESTKGYNPQEKLASGFYYQIPQGLTKSERKDFNLKNMKKVEELGGMNNIRARQELENREGEILKKFESSAEAGKQKIDPDSHSPCLSSRGRKSNPYEKYLQTDSDSGDSNIDLKLRRPYFDDCSASSSTSSTYDMYDSDDSDSTLKAEDDSDDFDSVCTSIFKPDSDRFSYSVDVDEVETVF